MARRSQPSGPFGTPSLVKELNSTSDDYDTALFGTSYLVMASYRPGGLVLDFSDFYWYREFAQLTHQGYYPYKNLWTTYPPLFPVVMIAIYQLSTLLPPWEFPNLWFTLLLGGFFLLLSLIHI